MDRKIGLLLVIAALALPASAASQFGTISGIVRNSAGAPQMGAEVRIFAPALSTIRVLTDDKGSYTSGNIPPGSYEVKVSALSFLPSLQEDVSVSAGASLIVNITLNTLFEAMDLLPALRAPAQEDDWNWTLRSAANRPILRVLDDGPLVVGSHRDSDKERTLKARVAFVAGAEADGFGSPGDMTTRFTVERSLFSAGTLALQGDVGNSDGPQGVLRASYSQQRDDGSIPELAVTMRRFSSAGGVVGNPVLEAMELRFADTFSFGDALEVKLGSDFQSIQFGGRVSAWRPFTVVDLHLSPDTVLEYQYTTSQPNTRSVKGYDSAPADLSESGPQFSLDGSRAVLQRSHHHELSLSRRAGKNRFQVAAYRDNVQNSALIGASSYLGNFRGVLPDVYSGTFSYNAGNISTDGFRMVAEREISSALTANVTYSFGGVLELANGAREWNSLGFAPAGRHSVSGQVLGDTPRTQTRWMASYKWTSGQPIGQVDMFNDSPGKTDPYLNFFIRQPLPSSSIFSGRFEALVDLRNLLAQGYVPVVGTDGRTVYLVQSARSVRGGLAFVF